MDGERLWGTVTVLTTWLWALIVGGAAGLIAPSDPATIYGRIGRRLRQITVAALILALVFMFLDRDQLIAEFKRMI